MNRTLKENDPTGRIPQKMPARSRIFTQTASSSAKDRKSSTTERGILTDRSQSICNSTVLDKKSKQNTGRSLQTSNSCLTLSRSPPKSPVNSQVRWSNNPMAKVIPKPVAQFIPKSTLHIKSPPKSVFKSAVKSTSKSFVSQSKSPIFKSRSMTKTPLNTFSKKPILEMETIKEQNFHIKLEELQKVILELRECTKRSDSEIQSLKRRLDELTEENYLLTAELQNQCSQGMMRNINNRILQGLDLETERELERLTRLQAENQSLIDQLGQDTLAANDTFMNDMVSVREQCEFKCKQLLLALQCKQRENQRLIVKTLDIQTATEQLEGNNITLSQSVLVKGEENTQLRMNLEACSKSWETKTRYLEDQLEHSKLQYLKKQRELETTRMILEQERDKSFSANQHLMTMITETDFKSEEEILRLKERVIQLESHLKDYEQYLQGVERDTDAQQRRRVQFQQQRDREMNVLEEMINRIKEEGLDFLKTKGDEVCKRHQLAPKKSIIH